jgi:hypothetical protein
VGLARPGRPQEHDVLLRLHEVERPEVGDDLSADRALVVVVEVLHGLAGREPGGTDPGLAAVALAGATLRSRQAARYASSVQPSERARSASRLAASARDGALSAQHR